MSMSKVIFLFYLLIMSLLLYKFLSTSTHLMVLLLTLEMIMLVNLWTMIFLILNNFLSMNFLIVYFTLSVCEACLGLSVLVCISRYFGEEMKKNF